MRDIESLHAALAASSPAVLEVGKWLHYAGRGIWVPPLRFAPSLTVAHEYSDGGDLFVEARDNSCWQLVEVKQNTGANWRCRDEWPERFCGLMFVTNPHRLHRDVHAYVIVNNALDTVAVVPGELKSTFSTHRIFMKNSGKIEPVCACSPDQAIFVRMVMRHRLPVQR